MRDLIDRQLAIDALERRKDKTAKGEIGSFYNTIVQHDIDAIVELPSAQPTLFGYNVEHLELIARVLQKENLPPEKVAEALTNISKIVAIVKDEFEETLREAVQNVEWKTE